MTWDPVHDGRAAFLACLWAMANPGQISTPPPGARLSADRLLDQAAGLLLGLLDPGFGLGVAGDAETVRVGEILRGASGAHAASLADADYVLVGRGAGPVAASSRRGTSTHPELGATLVYVADTPHSPTRMTVAGVRRVVPVPLAATEVEAVARRNAAPPCGVDLLIVAAEGLMALPRVAQLGAAA